jgi:FKBP-type peptidyl-prolyl cis-trans isomerase FklB
MKIRLPSQVAATKLRRTAGHVVLLIVAAFSAAACQKAPSETKAAGPAFDTDIAKASYGLGYNIAGNVNNQYGNVLDGKAFSAGIEDGFSKAQMKVPEDAVLASLNALNDAREKDRGAAGERNLAAAKAYLLENGKKPGVVTLPSGLEYEVLVTGTGPKPTLTDAVTTHYTGSLVDGTVFDSSVERGTPAHFPVNGVIPGWVEALQLMPVGSKWRIVVPPDLGYAERGAGNKIGPNEALIFTVELLSIDKAA